MSFAALLSLAPTATPSDATVAAAASAPPADTVRTLFDTLVLGRGDLLWLLVLAPLIAGAYVWASRRRKQAMIKLGNPTLVQRLVASVHRGNRLLLAVLTTRGEISRVVSSNILATICGLLVFAPAAMHWGVRGGLYASSCLYICALLVTLILLTRTSVLGWRDFVGRLDRGEARRIAGFYPMLVFHAVMAPLSLILIREHVTSQLSLESAGLWQACWRLSETYTMVVMMSVTTQFMARLGEVANHPDRLRAEVLRTLGASVGATAAMALCIFVLREWIVRLIFSRAFSPVTELMPMQLVGDVLKMAGWTLGFVLVATVRSRWYIAIELVVPLVFIVMARVLGASMGVSGVTMAYVAAGAAQCLMAFVALRDVIFIRRPAS